MLPQISTPMTGAGMQASLLPVWVPLESGSVNRCGAETEVGWGDDDDDDDDDCTPFLSFGGILRLPDEASSAKGASAYIPVCFSVLMNDDDPPSRSSSHTFTPLDCCSCCC